MLPDFFSKKTDEWFRGSVGEPTAVQMQGWCAIASGDDVLISAPTGTGKTLTAFLYGLDTLSRRPAQGCKMLYISPLKALGNDIRENLNRPLTGLGLEKSVRVGVRTGDTTQSERARMLKNPPQILITTPESLYLLLTSSGGRRMLAGIECVIVDELHSVINGKRGVHLMLSLSRLDAICGRHVQRIGLSATVDPLEEAAMYISGGRGAQIVAPEIDKALEIRVELAEKDMRVLPEHSIWPSIAEKTYAMSKDVRTMLAFVDGRFQAEKLANGINAVAGEWYARTHHGCVSKEQRLEAERQLRSGELSVLCCTSTMELGIDVGDIDLVLQIGAPRSIAGTMQRAGRAGHGPGRISKLTIFPKTGPDCLDAALAARGALDRRIEKAHVPLKCLDVISQQLLSMAAVNEFTVDEALTTINSAWPCRDVTKSELESVLRMLAGDFEHDRDVPVRPRLIYDRINGIFRGDNYTRMLAVANVGTIPDRGWYSVMLQDGTRLGELDEEYVFEARLGDKFLLGAFAWRITEITKDKVVVSPATPEGAQPPFWKGDIAGRPMETALYYGALMREMNTAWHIGDINNVIMEYPVSADCAAEIKRYVRAQTEATGCLPDDRTIIFEHFTDAEGQKQLMIHSIFGSKVNHALSMIFRHYAAQATGLDINAYDDEGGILIYPMGGGDLPDGLYENADPDTARALIRALMPAEPMFSMVYRYDAARSGLMGMRGRGRQPLWVQRLRGAESLSGAAVQAGHPLIEEAMRECIDDLLDVDGAELVLRDIRSGVIRVREIHLDAASPMSLPLRRQFEADMMYTYNPIPATAIKLAEHQVESLIPESETVRDSYARDRRIDSPDALHSVMMAEGDLMYGDVEAPAKWFEELSASGRAMYIEPGLWIAAEHADQYTEGDMERIVRRCLRYRGAQDAMSIAQRYAIGIEKAEQILSSLENSGAAKVFEGMYVHTDVYSYAQRQTIALRRARIATALPERFAALLVRDINNPLPAAEKLRNALKGLKGMELPAAMWEDVVFPARVPRYRGDHLDALLAEGEYSYSLKGEGEKLLISFSAIEDQDIDTFVPPPSGMGDRGQRVLSVLEKGGAQFDYVISRRLGGAAVTDDLMYLCANGLVVQDSFAPVRRILAKRVMRGGQSSGRWERAHALRALAPAEVLDAAFDRCPVLCRETISGMSWSAALEILRVMEMTGAVRRGYFVEGLSGAQFVRERDFTRVTTYLAKTDEDFVCINATDPAQAWGRYLPHMPGREFMLVGGTAVVMKGGRPTAVFERYGASVRFFEDGANAAACFAQAFRKRAIFPGRSRVCVTGVEPSDAACLGSAGFMREALDYVIYQD